MTHIKTAIRDAIKDIDFQHWVHIYDAQVQMNGNNTVTFLGDGNHDNTLPIAEILLSPDFWKCLGKARGWNTRRSQYDKKINGIGMKDIGDDQAYFQEVSLYHQHSLIDHIWEGGTAESFFASLEE